MFVVPPLYPGVGGREAEPVQVRNNLFCTPISTYNLLNSALALNKHQQTYTVLGRVYLMSGDVAGAVNVYKEAVK